MRVKGMVSPSPLRLTVINAVLLALFACLSLTRHTPKKSKHKEVKPKEAFLTEKVVFHPGITTFRCVEGAEDHVKGDANIEKIADAHRACEYKNLYWDGQRGLWVAVMEKEADEMRIKPVWQSSKNSLTWRPVMELPSLALAERMASNGGWRVKDGVHLLFGQPWTHNIGHGLWDGLYAAWLAATRLGYGSVGGVLRPIVSQYDVEDAENGDRQQFDLAVERFSGEGKYQRMRELRENKGWVRFDVVLVGSGAKGQRWMNKNLRLPGFEEDTVRTFRNRMYRTYGMPGPRSWKAGRRRQDMKAIIVDNKRYSESDKKEMEKLIAVATIHGYHLTYVDWAAIGAKPDAFGAHLEVLQDTDVYISGPGTGMMYAPFLPDKAVFIGLGGMRTANNLRWVTYMEEYVCEGTPYIRALYYPSRLRVGGVRVQVLAGLLDDAMDMVSEGHSEPLERGANLSPEGRLFTRACAAAPADCQYVLDGMNGMRGGEYKCMRDGWAEFAVHEIGVYNETQAIEADGNMPGECMNHGFRSALRKEAARAAHALARPCPVSGDCETLLQFHVQDVEAE